MKRSCLEQRGPWRWLPLCMVAVAWASGSILILSPATPLDRREAALLEAARESSSPPRAFQPERTRTDSQVPPFPAWLLATAFDAGGRPSVACARLVSALLAAVFLAGVHLIAMARWGHREATMALLGAATSLIFLRAFEAATTAPFAAAGVTAALACFVWRSQRHGAGAWVLLALGEAFLSLALLSSGPMVLPVAFLGTLFARREGLGGRTLVGTLLLVAPPLLLLPALRSAGGDGGGLIESLMSAWQAQAPVPWASPAGLALLALPAALPLAAALLPGTLHEARGLRTWFLVQLLGACLMRDASGLLLLMLLVPASLLTAHALILGFGPQAPRILALAARFHMILVLLGGAAVLGLSTALPPAPTAPMPLAAGAGLLAVSLLWSLFEMGRGSPRGPLPVLLASLPLALLAQTLAIKPSSEDQALRNLGLYIKQEVPEEAPILIPRDLPARLLFYMDHQPLLRREKSAAGGLLPAASWVLLHGEADTLSLPAGAREQARAWLDSDRQPYVLLSDR